jgi:hypothetical protein
VERGKAAGWYAPALECGSPSLRYGFPAVLGLMARRETRSAHFVRYARTIATSQKTMRAGARGHEPCAPRRRICRCRRASAHGFAGSTEAFIVKHHDRFCVAGGTRWGRFVGRREAQHCGRRARSARFVI